MNALPSAANPISECVAARLHRIVERQADVQAWSSLDAVRALRDAAALAAMPADDRPPLAGITLGVKDTIDAAGLPTNCGSALYENNIAAQDAALVASLRHLGMVVLGKTVSAEFAFRLPPVTRNPLDLARSPGGSSSGSAAAVADGQVDVALGTQTAGSIIRPAAFCGVVGFKPTHGRFSLAGIKSTAPTLDTVGWISADLALTTRVFEALSLAEVGPARQGARLSLCRTAHWGGAEPWLRQAIEGIAQRCGATGEAVLPADIDAQHAIVMRHELRRELSTERLQHRAQLSPLLADFLDADIVSDAAYAQARSRVTAYDEDDIFGGADVLLTPATAGEAVVQGTTGDPRFNAAWTLLGLPCLNLPFARGPHGLPVSLQLVGRRHQDDTLLAIAASLQGHFPSPGDMR